MAAQKVVFTMLLLMLRDFFYFFLLLLISFSFRNFWFYFKAVLWWKFFLDRCPSMKYCISSMFLKFPEFFNSFGKKWKILFSRDIFFCYFLWKHFLKDKCVLIFLVALVRLKCCRRELPPVLQDLPFDLIWYVFMLSLLLLCLKMLVEGVSIAVSSTSP